MFGLLDRLNGKRGRGIDVYLAQCSTLYNEASGQCLLINSLRNRVS